MVRLQLPERDAPFGQGVLRLGLQILGGPLLGCESAPVREKALVVARRAETDPVGQGAVLLGPPPALRLFSLRLVDLLLDPFDAVAALRLDGLANVVALRPLAVLPFGQGRDARREARDVPIEMIEAAAQQFRLVAG